MDHTGQARTLLLYTSPKKRGAKRRKAQQETLPLDSTCSASLDLWQTGSLVLFPCRLLTERPDRSPPGVRS